MMWPTWMFHFSISPCFPRRTKRCQWHSKWEQEIGCFLQCVHWKGRAERWGLLNIVLLFKFALSDVWCNWASSATLLLKVAIERSPVPLRRPWTMSSFLFLLMHLPNFPSPETRGKEQGGFDADCWRRCRPCLHHCGRHGGHRRHYGEGRLLVEGILCEHPGGNRLPESPSLEYPEHEQVDPQKTGLDFRKKSFSLDLKWLFVYVKSPDFTTQRKKSLVVAN